MISYDAKSRRFHLANEYISDVIGVTPEGILIQCYFGKRISGFAATRRYPAIDRSFSPNLPGSDTRGFSLDTCLQVYPGTGDGDFRSPAQRILYPDGTSVTSLRYVSYQITAGKPDLEGLPSIRIAGPDDAQTLTITMADTRTHLRVALAFTIYAHRAVVTRSVRFFNDRQEPVMLEKAASCDLDLPDSDYSVIHLPGAWARERQATTVPLTQGATLTLGSNRGISSHHDNPFIALVRPDTTEFAGEAIGLNLVYSGSHQTTCQVDTYGQLRVQMGIDPSTFSWQLAPGEHFQTPEVVMVYSDKGLNAMSQTFHALYNERLIHRPERFATTPVLINNWEATYTNFTEAKLLTLADAAKQAGVELFVLDDGWFGHRDNDQCSLGDWIVNREKLPHGLSGLGREIHKRGMLFGLWIEPEAVSEDSDLYRQHPDWVLQLPDKKPAPSRSEYLLDFSRAEVRQAIFDQITAVIDSAQLDYIKWDLNRAMTDVYSRAVSAAQQGMVAHRYVLGVYAFMQALTTRYPEILFEGCAGGGARFDPGVLYYLPQIWVSDNTDAIARGRIQMGTSLCYPPAAMGNHVSASPNEQTHRLTPLTTRYAVADSGWLGYELDMTGLSGSQLATIKQQIANFHHSASLVAEGKYYRLWDAKQPGDPFAWQQVSPDRRFSRAVVVRPLAEASPNLQILRLVGLDPAGRYTVNGEGDYGGDELMYAGIYLPTNDRGDFQADVFLVKARS